MDQRLSELIEDLTTSGEPQLNPAKMKELKKICKYVLRVGVPRGLAAQRARAPPAGFPWAPGMSHRPPSQAPTGASAGKEPQALQRWGQWSRWGCGNPVGPGRSPVSRVGDGYVSGGHTPAAVMGGLGHGGRGGVPGGQVAPGGGLCGTPPSSPAQTLGTRAELCGSALARVYKAGDWEDCSLSDEKLTFPPKGVSPDRFRGFPRKPPSAVALGQSAGSGGCTRSAEESQGLDPAATPVPFP